MTRGLLHFFDKLEDRIRIRLSHWPILYAIIGGIGIVLFWKGVWEIAEIFPVLFGIPSIILGVLILLSTGLLVSFFIGDSIIISGMNREKKLAEKTEDEVRMEESSIEHISVQLDEIKKELDEIKK